MAAGGNRHGKRKQHDPGFEAQAREIQTRRARHRLAGKAAAVDVRDLRIDDIRQNPYEFISERARDASEKYGVKSVSLLAIKR